LFHKLPEFYQWTVQIFKLAFIEIQLGAEDDGFVAPTSLRRASCSR